MSGEPKISEWKYRFPVGFIYRILSSADENLSIKEQFHLTESITIITLRRIQAHSDFSWIISRRINLEDNGNLGFDKSVWNCNEVNSNTIWSKLS